MALRHLEAESACSKPPADVHVRISTGERRGFGASAPSLTGASSLHLVRAECWVNSSITEVGLTHRVIDPDRQDISESLV